MEPNIVYIKFLEAMTNLMPDGVWLKNLQEIIKRFKELSKENIELKKELDELNGKIPSEVKMWGEN